MFEQQLYDQEASEVRLQPGDPFYNYEIKNWDFTPRVYKILSISAVANIVALLVIGSSGLLTARGCDSPFVGRVCQVLDTVYVGSVLFGTEKEYADVDYTKTELEDADITFVDVTGVTPPLTYPAGYFQLANPEQYVANVTEPLAPGYLAPGIPSNPTIGGSGLLNTPPIAPPSNPNPVEGELPTFGETNPNPTTVRNNRKRRPGQGPLSGSTSNSNANTDPTANANVNTNNPTVGEKKDEAKVDQNGVFINKRPLADKATDTLGQIDAGSVKLDQPFRVVITGTLGLADDGKTVVLKNPKAEPVDKNFPADPALTKLAQEWVVAVGDAGWYGYLGVLDKKKGVGRKITIMIEQNDANFLANVRTEQVTPELANTAATGLRNMMTIGAYAANEVEKAFLQSTKTASEGNVLVVNFEMPKTQVQEMIQRKLAEIKEKNAKPEGNAAMRPSDNKAER